MKIRRRTSNYRKCPWNYKVYKYTEKPLYVMRQYADVNGYQCMSYIIRDGLGGLVVVDGGRAWQSESLVADIKKCHYLLYWLTLESLQLNYSYLYY